MDSVQDLCFRSLQCNFVGVVCLTFDVDNAKTRKSSPQLTANLLNRAWVLYQACQHCVSCHRDLYEVDSEQTAHFVSWSSAVVITHRWMSFHLLVWRSSRALVSINEVSLCQVQLVLRWVTMSGFSSRCETFISYVTSHPGQLSLAILLWIGTMSTSQRAVMPCNWGVKAGMVCVWVAGKTVWSHCYTRPYLSASEIGGLYIKRYINFSGYFFTNTVFMSWLDNYSAFHPSGVGKWKSALAG